MKRIIELSENEYKVLKEDGVQNHIALADTIIARSVPYEERPKGDLISREALKKAIKNLYNETLDGIVKFGIEKACKEIDNAPTISPFKPMCKAKDEAICEEMTTDGHCNCSKPCPNKEIERTRGEWKEWTDERWGGTTIYCPYCRENALEKYIDGLHRQVKSNFCPYCGADMRK